MTVEPQESEHENAGGVDGQEHRPFLGVMVAVIVIVVIVLVLMMLRGCDKNGGATAPSNDSGSITAVEDLPADSGAVSVWLNDGADVNTVLKDAGVMAADVANMGGGRYVIAVPDGSEANTAARLVRSDGVIDAGLVYASGRTK